MAVITRWAYKRGGRKAGFHCILAQGFCLLKIVITQFRDGFCSKIMVVEYIVSLMLGHVFKEV